jgi:hypothetical protein
LHAERNHSVGSDLAWRCVVIESKAISVNCPAAPAVAATLVTASRSGATAAPGRIVTSRNQLTGIYACPAGRRRGSQAGAVGSIISFNGVAGYKREVVECHPVAIDNPNHVRALPVSGSIH